MSKVDKFDFIKTKKFCPSRYHKEEDNTSPKLGEIICSMYTSDKGLAYRKYSVTINQ